MPLGSELFQNGHIESVVIGANVAKVAYQTRDCRQFNFIFKGCYMVCERGCVNLDISHISVVNDSQLAKLILAERQAIEQYAPAPQKLWHYTFVESWQKLPVLEIAAELAQVLECGRSSDFNTALYDIRGDEYVGNDFPPAFV